MAIEVTLSSVISEPNQGSIAGKAQAADSQPTLESSPPPVSSDSSEVPYVSPTVKIDRELQRAIFVFRDQETGEVIQEFPSEEDVARTYEQSTQSSSLGQSVDISDSPAPESEDVTAESVDQEASQNDVSPDSDINNTVPDDAT